MRFLPRVSLILSMLFLASTLGAGESTARSLDRLQRQAFRYIWDDGDPRTGLAYEASFDFGEIGRPLAVGGTGFGLAAIVVAVERGWITRDQALERIERIVSFLKDETPRRGLHGAFPHWLHPDTGQAIRFSELDDGADMVETAFLTQGLLIARAYFDRPGREQALRDAITDIWEEVEWNWFADQDNGGLYWHWSPNHGFNLGLKLQGFNECLVAYILALASPTHPITRATYDFWTAGDGYRPREVFGYRVEAAIPGAGPLFLTHYSFVGLDPWQMADAHVPEGYLVRNVRHTLSNRGYCLYVAPRENRYGPDFWGLTASLVESGYAANDPAHDSGTIAPTAALSSMPYTPSYARDVLRFLMKENKAWGEFGPYDALNLRDGWYSDAYLAIDQLPIVSMVENYRSGLLWKLFMRDREIRRGLDKAGIAPPTLRPGFPEAVVTLVPSDGGWRADAFAAAWHPDASAYRIPYWLDRDGETAFTLKDTRGVAIVIWNTVGKAGRNIFHMPMIMWEEAERYTIEASMAGKVFTLPIRFYP